MEFRVHRKLQLASDLYHFVTSASAQISSNAVLTVVSAGTLSRDTCQRPCSAR